MRNKNHGAITIYLSIILSAVFMLSGVLMDTVRIRAAEIQLRRAANTAAGSALAGYSTTLKKDYGLFALHNSDSNYLEEDIKYYLTNQLITEEMNLDKKHQITRYPNLFYANNQFNKVNFIDLYDYHLENIEVIPIYNFTENEILRQQIIEYMKYRAPVQFAENFMEKIKSVASSKELASAYKQKITLEKKLQNIEKALSRLQEQLNLINKFDKENFDSSYNSNSQLMDFSESLILREIYKECRGADFGTLETPEEEEAVTDIKDKIRKRYDRAREKVKNYSELLEEQLMDGKNAVEDARRELENILVLTKQVQQEIANLKAYLIELQNSKDDHSKVITAMQKDIDQYEKLLVTEKSQSISMDLNNNLEVLNFLETSTSELPAWIALESRQISAKALRNVESSYRDGSGIDIINQSQLNSFIKKLASDTELKSIKK